MATFMLKESTSSQKLATSMLKVASDIYKMPLYRTAHSPENSSDKWALFFLYIKYTFVVTQIATKSWIKNHLIFSKILEVRGTKMKKIHEELWAERRRELPPRQERSPRRHGAGPHQDEPAAGARVKTSVERRRPTAFRDGGLTVFLFKTGKYWNGKGRNIPYKWRFKSRNLAQRPKLRFGCLTKRR